MIDQDAIVAAADLVQRSGARQFEIGYRNDDEGLPPTEQGWYAHAVFRGRRVIEESVGPVEAAEGLARRLLDGARCRRCGEPIRLDDTDPGCRWTRMGPKWRPGCGLPIDRSIPRRD